MTAEKKHLGRYKVSQSYHTKLVGREDNLEVVTVWHKTFEVSGWCHPTKTGFRTVEAAETYAEECAAFDKKFPFKCPRSAREIAKAKRLGLSVNN
jgi:hypothetical protein